LFGGVWLSEREKREEEKRREKNELQCLKFFSFQVLSIFFLFLSLSLSLSPSLSPSFLKLVI